MKIIVGSDHGGLSIKKLVLERLAEKGVDVTDAGPNTAESCDYPDYAFKVANAVAAGEYDGGVLICGTGLGMSMAANRVPGVRAALCTSEFHARMSRAHNNANVLCLGERTTGPGLALSILDVWLESGFEGGRHLRRIEKIDQEK